MNKFYQMVSAGKEADIYIFGDIVEPTMQALDAAFFGINSDVSGFSLVKDIQALDVDVIKVHINSYGGHVSEGLAIHNTLKQHKAKIITICDGFACSAASVVFMAGEERIMNPASLLMIHNAWQQAAGNAEQLRKQADDLEKISSAAAETYMGSVNISREKLDELLAFESWINPAEAVQMGFATSIAPEKSSNKASQSARQAVYHKITAQAKPLQAEVKITDLNEFKQMFAAMQQEIAALKPQQAEPKENTTIDFLNAMIGRKG